MAEEKKIEILTDGYYYQVLDYVRKAYAVLKKNPSAYGTTESALYNDDEVKKAIVSHAKELGVEGISERNVEDALNAAKVFAKDSGTRAEALDKVATDKAVFASVKESEIAYKADVVKRESVIFASAQSYADVKKVVDAYVEMRKNLTAYGLSAESTADDFKAAMLSYGFVNMSISQLNDAFDNAQILSQGKASGKLNSLEFLSRNPMVIASAYKKFDGRSKAALETLEGRNKSARLTLRESAKKRNGARRRIFGTVLGKILMVAIIPGAIAGLFFGAAALAGGFAALSAVANIGIVTAAAFTGFLGYHILKGAYKAIWNKLTSASIKAQALLSADENVVGSKKNYAKNKQLAKTAEKEFARAQVKENGLSNEDRAIIASLDEDMESMSVEIEDVFSDEVKERIKTEEKSLHKADDKERIEIVDIKSEESEERKPEEKKEETATEEEYKHQTESVKNVLNESKEIGEKVEKIKAENTRRARPEFNSTSLDETQELKVSEESKKEAYSKFEEQQATFNADKKAIGSVYNHSLEKTLFGGSEELKASDVMIKKSIGGYVNSHSKDFKEKGVNTGKLIKSMEAYYFAESVADAMVQREIVQKELEKVGATVEGTSYAIGNALNERYQKATVELATREGQADKLKEMRQLEKDIDKKATNKIHPDGIVVDFINDVKASKKDGLVKIAEELLKHEKDPAKVDKFIKIVKFDKDIIDKAQKYLQELPKDGKQEASAIEKIAIGESLSEDEKLVVEMFGSAVMPMYKERLDREIAEQQEQARKGKELKEEAKRKKKEEKRKEKVAKVIKRGLEKAIQEDIDIEQGKQQEK